MILVLDADTLILTPFSKPSWSLLKARADRWGIWVVIPRVCAVEAIGHEYRKLDAVWADLRKVDRQAVVRLGSFHPGRGKWQV
jgi:hypothetical protein